MDKLSNTLKKKGWTQHEVKKTVDIMTSPEKKEKHIKYRQEMSRLLYWMTLLVLIVCNFIVSIFLIPFLIALTTSYIYLIVAAMGLIFGFLLNILIQDIEHLETKHHVFAVIIIPTLAIVNLFVMVGASNKISTLLEVNVQQNPYLVSVFYVIPLLLPFLFSNTILLPQRILPHHKEE